MPTWVLPQEATETRHRRGKLLEIEEQYGDWWHVRVLGQALDPPPDARVTEPDGWLAWKPEQTARELVRRHWRSIEALAAALLERETLDAAAVAEIIAATAPHSPAAAQGARTPW